MKVIVKTEKEILFDATETTDTEKGKELQEKMDDFDNRIVKSVLIVPAAGTKLINYNPMDVDTIEMVEITLEEEK